MRLFIWILILSILVSCKKNNDFTTDPSAKLSFSTDSILFDTIFTSVGSVTRRIKIFNTNNKAVKISEIKLAGGTTSPFQLNINGKAAHQEKDIELAAMDSMVVFVKAIIDSTTANIPFIVADSILFTTNGNIQTVQLAAYGQNARFINNLKITQNTTWNNTLPYVIYNSVNVNSNVKLEVEAGCRLYFHKDATLIINGTLLVNGTTTDSVTFTSDRQKQIYDAEAGQWRGIQFRGSSKDNIIKGATIKNAISGISVDSASVNGKPKLILVSSIVKNMQIAGLVATQSSCNLYNNLFFNCGNYLVYGIGGGNFDIKQNTFANYNFKFARSTPSLFFSDNQPTKPGKTAKLTINLTNNSIWGALDDELIVEKKGSAVVDLDLTTNLLKSKSTDYNSKGNLLNMDPQFIYPRHEDYKLTSNSPCLKKGVNLSADPYYSSYLSKDIKGIVRNFPATLGCYEVQ